MPCASAFPEQHLHDGRVEQLEHLDGRSGAGAPDQLEALAEAGAAVGGVLPVGDDTERLAEVLLVQAADGAVGFRAAVVARDKQAGPVSDDIRFDRRRVESKSGGEPHGERLVFGRRRKTGDGGLEDVRGRLAGGRKSNPSIDEDHRHLGLCPGERQAKAPRTGQEGPRIETRQEGGELVVRQRHTGDPGPAEGGGVSPAGHNESAPATSPPSCSSSLNSLARDTPRAAATASRCAPSGSSPSKKGRLCRGGNGSGRSGSETESAGAAAFPSQSPS